MAKDRILIVGFDNDNTQALLGRLGYETLRLPEGTTLADYVANELVDSFLIESNAVPELPDMVDFLRGFELTRSIPIVSVVDRPRQLQEIKEKRLPRVELMQKPVSIGLLASRLATQLRVRKQEGADRTRAALVDVNANLRDVNDRLSREREEARRIQQALLPQQIPANPHFKLAALYKPLDEVGGDWYHFAASPEGVLDLQIADITGHGLSAAFIGSMTKLAINAASTSIPGELLARINNLIVPVLPEGRFVTMAAFEYTPATKKLLVAAAGHPPSILWRAATGKTEELKALGFALGFEADAPYRQIETTLERGDVLVTFTDGVTEATNRSNEMFGAQRLAQAIAKCPVETEPNAIINQIMADFDQFRDHRLLKDDVTIVALKAT